MATSCRWTKISFTTITPPSTFHPDNPVSRNMLNQSTIGPKMRFCIGLNQSWGVEDVLQYGPPVFGAVQIKQRSDDEV